MVGGALINTRAIVQSLNEAAEKHFERIEGEKSEAKRLKKRFKDVKEK